MNGILSLQGRASRSDWWITTISGAIVAQIAFVIAFISRFQESGPNWAVFVLSITGGVVALWTTVAVTARRFRDRGDSPWMTLLLAIPILGEIWVLIVCGFLPNPHLPKRKLVVKKVTADIEKPDSEEITSPEA